MNAEDNLSNESNPPNTQRFRVRQLDIQMWKPYGDGRFAKPTETMVRASGTTMLFRRHEIYNDWWVAHGFPCNWIWHERWLEAV